MGLLLWLACSPPTAGSAAESPRVSKSIDLTEDEPLDTSDSSDSGSPSDTGDTGDSAADDSGEASDTSGATDTGDTADSGTEDSDGDGVIDELDCAPDDATTYAGAPEVCGDAIDNNCNGSADGCGLPASGSFGTADVIFTGVLAGDGAGYAAWVGDLDGDGIAEVVLTAFDENTTATWAGAVYVEHGPITTGGSVGAFDATLYGESANAHAGRSVWGGDFDSDGEGDLLIGAAGDASVALDAGAVLMVTGPFSGSENLSAADVLLTGEEENDGIGWVVTGGDVNGDGGLDALATAREDDDGGDNAGAVSVVFGPLSSGSFADFDAKIIGEDAMDDAGWGATAVDMNGDAIDDVLLGAEDEDAGGDGAGAGYLVLGPLSGVHDLAMADAKIIGEDADDDCGRVTWGGDVDGDGTMDVVMTCTRRDYYGYETGAVYVIHGPHSGEIDLSAADAEILGEARDDWAGRALTAGDIDGDAVVDLVVGAEKNDESATDAGATYLLRGPFSGITDLSTADYKWTGETMNDKSGWVARTGDVDGDGWNDIVAGSWELDRAGEDAGGAYVLWGGPGL